MTKKEKVCAQIADKISAHRAIHGRNSIKRIYMSTALYEFLTGKKYCPKKPLNANLLGYEIKLYESDKMEYSFTDCIFGIQEGVKP